MPFLCKSLTQTPTHQIHQVLLHSLLSNHHGHGPKSRCPASGWEFHSRTRDRRPDPGDRQNLLPRGDLQRCGVDPDQPAHGSGLAQLVVSGKHLRTMKPFDDSVSLELHSIITSKGRSIPHLSPGATLGYILLESHPHIVARFTSYIAKRLGPGSVNATSLSALPPSTSALQSRHVPASPKMG